MNTLKIIIVLIVIVLTIIFLFIVLNTEPNTNTYTRFSWDTVTLIGNTTLTNIIPFTNYLIYADENSNTVLINIDISRDELINTLTNKAVMFTAASKDEIVTFQFTDKTTLNIRYAVDNNFIYKTPEENVVTWQYYYYPRSVAPAAIPDTMELRGVGSIFISY